MRVDNKVDKIVSNKKIKSIKHYFESLTDPQEFPKSSDTYKEKVDLDVLNTNVVQMESVVEKVNAFELLMKSRGDTPQKTPGKRVKRLVKSSVRK